MLMPFRGSLCALLGTLALVAILAACSGGSPASSSAPSGAGTSSSPPTVSGTASSATSSSPAGHSTSAPKNLTNVAYGTKSRSEMLDLSIPTAGNGPYPLVILVHRGAFKVGDKLDDGPSADADASLSKAYATASLNYRLSSEAIFPAAVQDVKAAVRFLRANASKYELDPTRFAAWGRSAGGNLVALLGTTGDQATIFDEPSLGNAGTSSAVQAVVDWYGPSDFLALDSEMERNTPAGCLGQTEPHNPADSPESIYLGGAIQTVATLAKATNPITYIATAKTLPVFSLAAGDSDCLIPHEQSELLNTALKAAGATSTYTLVPGAYHNDQLVTTSQTPGVLAMLAEVFGR
jgi:acetyl esterase/lipase